jgi:hypothetical protein
MDALAAALSKEAARMRRSMSDEELRESMDGEEVKDGFGHVGPAAGASILTTGYPFLIQVVSQHVGASPVVSKMSPELQALVLASLGDGGLTPDDFEVCVGSVMCAPGWLCLNLTQTGADTRRQLHGRHPVAHNAAWPCYHA